LVAEPDKAVDVRDGTSGMPYQGMLPPSWRSRSRWHANSLDVAAPPDVGTSSVPADYRPSCRCCGGRMIIIEVFERWQQPRGQPQASTTNQEIGPCPRMHGRA